MTRRLDSTGIHFVRTGRSANCSSLGSVIDVLFLGTVSLTAVIAATRLLRPLDEDHETPDEEAGDAP